MVVDQLEVYITPDGLGRAAIVRRRDNLLNIYVHWIWNEESRNSFNVEKGGRISWRDDKTPLEELYADIAPERGLYGELSDARLAITRLAGFSQATLEEH